MYKYFIIVGFLFLRTSSFCQDYISFRNTLNEGNYWFYESEFDSALVYYNKAEKFKLPFYPEEVHLFSRTLWELGDKKKSIKVLKSGGLKDFFLRDTTFYQGMSRGKRMKFASKLKLSEIDLLCDDIDFYDDIEQKDQMYRIIMRKLPSDSEQFDLLETKMVFQDSLNFIALIKQIKKNGYPGGYRMAPIGPGVVMLHAKKQWFLDYYYVFMREIEAGRMSYYDFSKALDRKLEKKDRQKPYNSYLPLEEAEVKSPALVFINRCSIGMSPYYDVYIPRLYPRGRTPLKSKLYEYYKREKKNFNSCRIK
tara:strand:+ start:117 stop:1040 length:924 start_codon:yes stop_codon:yes gene_type:complete